MQLIEYLKNELESRVKRNPGYSLRAFARALRMDASTLSALLNGKRSLTPKAAKRILDEMQLDPSTTNQLLLSSLSAEKPQEKKFEAIGLEQLEAIAGWEHYAILSLLEISEGSGTVRGIAKYFGLGTGVIINALGRLEKLELVKMSKGRWKSTQRQVTTPTDIPSSALRHAHKQYIERALYSLEYHAVEERDITGITMSISKKRLPQAKKLIQRFRRQLCNFLEHGKKDAVYRINIQLVPLRK